MEELLQGFWRDMIGDMIADFLFFVEIPETPGLSGPGSAGPICPKTRIWDRVLQNLCNLDKTGTMVHVWTEG